MICFGYAISRVCPLCPRASMLHRCRHILQDLYLDDRDAGNLEVFYDEISVPQRQAAPRAEP